MAQAKVARVPRRPFPEVGEVFPLTARETITGPDLVEAFGCNRPHIMVRVRYRGEKEGVRAGDTRPFRLVSVGRQPNLSAVICACNEQGGRIPSGTWVMSFLNHFQSSPSARFGGVGVPDPSWTAERDWDVIPYERPVFPAIITTPSSSLAFQEAWEAQRPDFLWLVEV